MSTKGAHRLWTCTKLRESPFEIRPFETSVSLSFVIDRCRSHYFRDYEIKNIKSKFKEDIKSKFNMTLEGASSSPYFLVPDVYTDCGKKKMCC